MPQPPTGLTGAATDKALLIANQRDRIVKPSKLPRADGTPALYSLLRAIAKSDGIRGKKNENAGIARTNYFEYQAYLEPFLEYGKKDSGFVFDQGGFAAHHTRIIRPKIRS